MRYLFAFLAFFVANVLVLAGDGNRLSYLDSNEVWYPHQDFPKLLAPQCVGEDGVESVMTLAIDDMRDTAKHEAYRRPILQRLKQIDGRALVSIMTNSVVISENCTRWSPGISVWPRHSSNRTISRFNRAGWCWCGRPSAGRCFV